MRHHYNFSIFREETEIFYYLLGVFLTDGNIFQSEKYNKLQLTSKDEDWIFQLQKILHCPAYPTKDGHKNLTINCKEICNILVTHGCIPNKSLVVKMPVVPNKYLADFIRGCIDGDGTIPNSKTVSCSLCSSSNKFLSEIQNILPFKSAIYTIKKKPYKLKNGKLIIPKHPHYRLMLTGKVAKKFLAWIYYPNHKLSMPRKNTIAQSIIFDS